MNNVERFTAACLALLVPASAFAAKEDFHDVAEMEAAVDVLDGGAGGMLRVFTIGTTPLGHDIRAVLLSEDRPSGHDAAGNADRPALLIECGTHAREWASPEMCLHLLQSISFAYFLDALLGTTVVEDIAAEADIWIIPMVNPDGRQYDDATGGDPEVYWTSTIWHPASSSDSNGWRTNAQTLSCPGGLFGLGVGIDLNRAYSQGWSSGDGNCLSNKFHGDFPFEAVEAQHMRKFVNNRMISMSMSVHSYSPCVGAQNGDADVPQNFRDVFNGIVVEPEGQLDYAAGTCEGKGVGQFTGWMAKPSDTAGAADHSTTRAAVSMLLELPPDGAAYDDTASPSPYRFDPFDASNPFHPSDTDYASDVAPAFYNAMLYLMRQARSPWCAIDPSTLLPDASCVQDFGLTGAKIANCRNCVGLLDNDVRAGEVVEVMPAGDRRVVYRVQNFDAVTASPQTVRVTTVISSRTAWPNPYTNDLVEARTYDLDALEGATDGIPFTFIAGREYMIGIYAYPMSYSGDTEPDNNTQLFRFEVQ
ncbi:MAG: M14 family zinc carboxypeptidase [Deltaproteobacteria bacterium]|jgi:hypothetical protein